MVPVERGHRDNRAECRFVHRNRQRTYEIVTLATEERMRLNVDRDVEIAGAATVTARVSHLPHSQPSAISDAGRHRDGNGFASHVAALPGADRAAGASLSAFPAARRARLREPHVAARPLNVSRALAFATGHFGNRHLAGAAARAAQDLARHQHLPLDAVHRISERDRDRRVQVDSDFGPSRARARHRVQDFSEQLAERRRLCAALRG